MTATISTIYQRQLVTLNGSGKDRSTPLVDPQPEDDDSTCPVLLDREMHSLHRNVPALRRRDVDTAAIRQHYYPEGGWGWIVCGAAFLAHLLTTGLQLAFGLLYLYTMQYLVGRNVDRDAYAMGTAWLGALCLCVSFLSAPIVIAICRRKSTRLAAVFGGLIMALACLFTSFAVQFHQAVLSYGVVMGVGAGLVRETSGLVLSHYFKRRREFVEMVAQAGSGVGVALFSVLYKEAVGKLGWRLGLQAVTGLLSLGFFLGIVYRSANLYHPQRRAITHLKNQRKKVKEKKTHSKTKKPPLFDFSPLRSRSLRVLMMACSTAALGLYTPVFYLAVQGYKEGLEDSALVLLQTFLGFASALGCVGFGLVTVRPSTQCLISRQYLCQAAMTGIGISLLALSAVQGYHGYVLFVWLYGICLGGFMYSLKMFTLERIRARHFTKAWGFVQGAESIPVLLGVPITGYINQAHPKAGYYFSFVSTMIGAALFFLIGQNKNKQQQQQQEQHNNTHTTSLPTNDCACPVLAASPYPCVRDVNPYGLYRQGSHQYERVFVPCNDVPNCFDRGTVHRHSYRVRREPTPPFLPKSLSYAANMDYSGHPTVRCITRDADFLKYSPHYRPRPTLRPSKSVPEGLARWNYNWDAYRRPVRRNVQVIEQITTSV
ncbi:hypothetical protein CBL_09749 [Carabus blaptoides fortunei]